MAHSSNSKVRYKVSINDYGYVTTLYTHANSVQQAKRNALTQYAKDRSVSVPLTHAKFTNSNRVEVKEA